MCAILENYTDLRRLHIARPHAQKTIHTVCKFQSSTIDTSLISAQSRSGSSADLLSASGASTTVSRV